MPSALAKSLFACLTALTGLLVAGTAAAQTGYGGTIGTGIGALSTSDFSFFLKYYDPGQKQWIQMNDTQRQYFFNQARCECIGDETDWRGYFKIAIQPTGTTTNKISQLLTANAVTGGSARLYAGGNVVNCLDPGNVLHTSSCLNLLDPSTEGHTVGIDGGMATIAANRVWESNPIPVAWLFNATGSSVCKGTACNATDNCDASSLTVTIYFWAQTTSLQTPDLNNLSFNINLVGKVSFAPINVTAQGGNEALTIKWGWQVGLNPSANPTFMGVQIFCVRGQDNQVFESGAYKPGYMTASSTCPNIVPPSASTGIMDLDPGFLCSGLLPSTATSHRITGLQNGIPYGVGIVAIDKYFNTSPIAEVIYATPVPTVDFYTQYKNAGGAAQGGFCSLASGARDPGLLAAGALVLLGLLAWRRRKRGRPGAGPLVLLLVASTLVASPARGQAIYHDDDFIHDEADRPWSGTPQSFAIEARFGLYTPAIDSELSGDTPGPQALIFGSKQRPMWQFEFDWQILQVFGSLAVGASVGYYKENAKACLLSSLTPENCEPSGDNTSLRLIPLAALLVYRFDVLAERWNIPLAPYGKVGLNYTIWTVTDGNGNIPSAGGGRGQGGTAGWQAAVGLALRLDFLDPAAARGFDADAGVNHSYAFFELDTIRSSGLGSKNALHVGDNTWFAGLMFEF